MTVVSVVNRSHTRYTVPKASAVTESRSLKKNGPTVPGFVSATTAIGVLHVTPLSVERATSTALSPPAAEPLPVKPLAEKASALATTSPVPPKLIQGAEAREWVAH